MKYNTNDWDQWDPIDEGSISCYGDRRWYEDDDERQAFINHIVENGGIAYDC